MDEKTERFTVSMPAQIAAAVDSVADRSFGGNRSAYVQALAEADLERRGELPGDPRADLHRLLDEALQGRDPAEIRARLEELVGAPAG